MKHTQAPCHIEGISVSKVELVVGGAGDMSMKVWANLVDSGGGIHGTTERVGGWSENVLSTIQDFMGALEEHVLAAHFEVEEGYDGGSAERETPTGILDIGLGSPGEP